MAAGFRPIRNSQSIAMGVFHQRAPFDGKRDRRSTRPASATGDDDLEILAGHDERTVSRAIELADEGHDIAFERRLRRWSECGERLEQRSVIGLEDVQPMFRRAIAEHEVSAHGYER